MSSLPSDWIVSLDEPAIAAGIRAAYTGNGWLGVRFGPSVLDFSAAPLREDTSEPPPRDGRDFIADGWHSTLSRDGYAGGELRYLPSWNRLHLSVDGVPYAEGSGTHDRSLQLDLRTGVVTLTDRWQPAPGRSCVLRAKLVVPRSHAHGSWYELELETDSQDVRLDLGIVPFHSGKIFASSPTRQPGTLFVDHRAAGGETFVQGLVWKTGLTESPGKDVIVELRGGAFSLMVFHAFHSGADARTFVEHDLSDLVARGTADVLEENRRLWADLWKDGLDFSDGGPDRARLLRIWQFWLLASLSEVTTPTSPLGLSGPGWLGSQLWDADLWLFRGILLLWPKLARSLVDYRAVTLPAARENAVRHGYAGAWFPWMSTPTGEDCTPDDYRNEIHIGIWIARAAWEVYVQTGDLEHLRAAGWPIISGVADFYCSWAKKEDDGRYHVRGVIPPDEHVTEDGPGTCDDSFCTNVGIRNVLTIARQAAEKLGVSAPPLWAEVEEGLYLQAPREDGVFPEYTGYTNEPIKQADVIIAFYPLGFPADAQTILANVAFYLTRLRATDAPIMTSQIEALLTMIHQDRAEGLEHLFKEFQRFVRGPFSTVYETLHNQNSFMLTGIAGVLQALIFGYYQARVGDASALPRIGRLP